jgi:hypothetical protein
MQLRTKHNLLLVLAVLIFLFGTAITLYLMTQSG